MHYSKPMPDLDLLMQEWPPEMEAMLKSMGKTEFTALEKVVLIDVKMFDCFSH